MAISRQTMTDEQRKSVALEYLKAFDNKGVTSNGRSILDLFADDAQVAAYGESQLTHAEPPGDVPAPEDGPGSHSFQQQLEKQQLEGGER